MQDEMLETAETWPMAFVSMKHCIVYKMEERRRNECTVLVEIASLTHHLQILSILESVCSHQQVSHSSAVLRALFCMQSLLATVSVGNVVLGQKIACGCGPWKMFNVHHFVLQHVVGVLFDSTDVGNKPCQQHSRLHG